MRTISISSILPISFQRTVCYLEPTTRGTIPSPGKGKFDPEVYARRLEEAFGKSSAYEVEAVDPENWPELKTCLGQLKILTTWGSYIYIYITHIFCRMIESCVYIIYMYSYICIFTVLSIWHLKMFALKYLHKKSPKCSFCVYSM